MKKRILSFAVILSMLMFAVPSASADESWREAFVTRIMKEMSAAPQYNEIALTDLDRNGIPEAFLYKNSADGGIGSAFTLSGSQITTISVPSNIIGSCLSDIEVPQRRQIYLCGQGSATLYISYKILQTETRKQCLDCHKDS